MSGKCRSEGGENKTLASVEGEQLPSGANAISQVGSTDYQILAPEVSLPTFASLLFQFVPPTSFHHFCLVVLSAKKWWRL